MRPRSASLSDVLKRMLGEGTNREDVARTLVRLAIAGDMQAIKEVFLRVDGAVPREARVEARIGQVIRVQWGDELPSGSGDLNGLVLAAGPSAIAYLDPPWRAQDAAAFRTRAGAGPARIPFVTLIDRVLDVVTSCRTIFVEWSARDRSVLDVLLPAHGWLIVGDWPAAYAGRYPCRVVVAVERGVRAPGWDGAIWDDRALPLRCLRRVARPGDVVGDPVVGRGLTALAADDLGLPCVAMELHPRRLAVAIDHLARRGHQPERLA